MYKGTKRKMEIMKSRLIIKISLNKFYVWLFLADFAINKRECNIAWQ